MTPLRLFISYSHQDKQYLNELEKHLTTLKRENLIDTWHDRKIIPSQEWEKKIEDALEDAMIKNKKNLDQLSLDLQGNTQVKAHKADSIIKDKKGSHLKVVATTLGSKFTKMQVTAMNPYSEEITRIIRDKGRALGW